MWYLRLNKQIHCVNNIQIRVAVKREAAVTKEMNTKLADDKKISRKEKDERILWKKNEVILHNQRNIGQPKYSGSVLNIVCLIYLSV